MRHLFFSSIVLLFLTILTSGCATTQHHPTTENNPAPEKIKLDSFELAEEKVEHLPSRVAILPFENATTNEKANNIVRLAFYNHFSAKRYRDIELFEIDDILSENDLYQDNKFASFTSSDIGHMLQADGLIYGKILGFNRAFLGIYSQVSVELEVWLVDAASGETIWKVQHKATAHEGNVPLDPISFIPTIYRATMKMRGIEMVRTAEDLCRTIVCALPEPKTIRWQNSVGGQSLAAVSFDNR